MLRRAGRPREAAAPAIDARTAKIYGVVRSIPRGRVATYGEIAALAGIPSGHRIAARAMRGCPESLPWQRVIGKKDARRGQINIEEPDHAALQRALLESEGVVFDENGFVLLGRSGWWLDSTGPAEGTLDARRRKRKARRAAGAKPAKTAKGVSATRLKRATRVKRATRPKARKKG